MPGLFSRVTRLFAKTQRWLEKRLVPICFHFIWNHSKHLLCLRSIIILTVIVMFCYVHLITGEQNLRWWKQRRCCAEIEKCKVLEYDGYCVWHAGNSWSVILSDILSSRSFYLIVFGSSLQISGVTKFHIMRNKNGEGLMNLSVEYATVNLNLCSVLAWR